jgi:toxin ParE1/3/4
LGRSHVDVPQPYLVYAVGRHLTIYRFNQPLNRVEVLNVLHPSMDIEKRLHEDLKATRRSD